ncbi:MAG: hypothetical protein GWO04_39300, partial [Actinobacteria bacterium]|nr:hypothetical protein [Actinomycetota bacterium]
RRRRHLHAYLLNWDFALIYALEREPLPRIELGRRTHERVHFELDSEHPLAGSHHQKIVVIDDAVAFVGGLDLTIRRWDTPDHRPDEPRRVDPRGESYGPFHDVQMAVDGEAATALGELARRRWFRATGERIRSPRSGRDVWPPDLAADMENVEVAVARTRPAWGGEVEIREVETLHLDAIAAARSLIYFENQ